MYVGIDAHSAELNGEGNATYTRGLISALLAQPGDARFALFARNPDHPFYKGLSSRRSFQVLRVAPAGGAARLTWALGLAASRAGVDCLHVQYIAPLGYRGPLVITLHDLGYLHVPDSFPLALRLGLRALMPRSVARAAHIITGSEFARREILAHYALSPERVSAIPLGTHPRFFPRDDQDAALTLGRYGLRPGYVFSLGRLNRRKNLARLLEAWRLLCSSGNAVVPLVIAGKPDFGTEDLLRRAGLAANGPLVQLVGLVPDDDLPALFRGAACFVYPSLYEGFGLPPLEAMACGTPLVVSNTTALPELVGDAALLIDPQSVTDIGSALTRILHDHALARDLAARGIARSRAYSWSTTAQHTLEVYRRVTRS